MRGRWTALDGGVDAVPWWVQQLPGMHSARNTQLKELASAHLVSHRAETSSAPVSILLPVLADGSTAFSVSPHRRKAGQLEQGQMEATTGRGRSKLQVFDEVRRPCRILSALASQPRGSRRQSST